ncbi:MAG: FtsX-like permease family protein [Patescibacteria group bacterium]
MKIADIYFLASSSLKNRKLRSILTIGGMAIGIGAIVFLVSLGFGLQALIVEQVTNVEALTVLDVSTGASALLEINNKVLDDFAAIEKVTEISPSLSLSGQAVRQSSATDIAIFGINPKFIALEGVQVSWGSDFTEQVEGKTTFETIMSNTAVELVGVADVNEVVGQNIIYKLLVPELDDEGLETGELVTEEVQVKVVGVVDEELTLGYVPLAVVAEYGLDDYNLARVKVGTRDDLKDVRTVIEGMGYQVDSVADTVGQIDQIFVVFELVMAGFGLIAMLVASLGAFNTLTVSLLERTREVGLMMALGTKRKYIYRLFLTESFLIGLIGGVSGLLFGYGFGELVNFIINRLALRLGGTVVDIFSTPLIFVGIIMVVILGVSFLTGIYPARRASRINPLDALRYE